MRIKLLRECLVIEGRRGAIEKQGKESLRTLVELLGCVRLLCDPMDCSPPGSSVHEILQARTLQRVAIPSSRGPSRRRDPARVSARPALAGTFFLTRAARKSIQKSG